VLVPFIVTRIAVLVVAEVAALTIPWTLGSRPELPPATVPWNAPLLTMDAGWYLRIAESWYQYDPQAGPLVQQSPVFFPLYPGLVRLVNTVAAGASVNALPATALIVANVTALVALALLYHLVRREFTTADAQRTVWYLLAFPVSFSLSAAYAEPVFLLACVGAVYAARLDRWWLAGLAGAAAALSRPYGVLIVVPLAFEYARTHWGSLRSVVRVPALGLSLPVVGLGAWMVYMYTLSGDPLLFGHLQVAWDNQQLTSPLDTFLTGYGRTRDQQLQGRLDIGSLRFIAAAVGVAATIASWRTLPPVYAAFSTVFCLVILSSGSLVSIWRHVFLIFPIFMVAGRAGRFTVFDRTYVSLSLACTGLLVVLLSTNWAMVS